MWRTHTLIDEDQQQQHILDLNLIRTHRKPPFALHRTYAISAHVFVYSTNTRHAWALSSSASFIHKSRTVVEHISNCKTVRRHRMAHPSRRPSWADLD